MTEKNLPGFTDPGAYDQPYGFSTRYLQDGHLPGTTWEEGNMFRGLILPNCDMDNGVFHDTATWAFGDPDRLRVYEKPEDRVLSEIFYSDASRRLQAVEQLTLPPEYSTIPNTAAFSRFEHIWGSALFVRQMGKLHGITGRDLVGLQLRTMLADVGHTFGSHLRDWLFQGVGKAENHHDLGLPSYLGAMGINDILRLHDYDPRDVTLPPGHQRLGRSKTARSVRRSRRLRTTRDEQMERCRTQPGLQC